MSIRFPLTFALAAAGFAQAPSQPPAPRSQEPMKPLYVLEDSYLKWRLLPAEQPYAAIDGKHLKEYVGDQTAVSRRYRDSGHQFWGRIIGTEADAENAQWLLGKFRNAGLADVHEQSFDLPPQWMPQSWNVSAAAGGKTLELQTAQPSYLTPATPSEGLDLEAVDVGFASDGDLAARDLRGKAVFFYSTDYMSRHSTINGGAIKRITDHGASAIFVTLLIPGNQRYQFYPVASTVPTFALGYDDGLAVREMIGKARGVEAPHVKLRLDVKMVPGLKTATIWGTLPGTSDEDVFIVAHRDGWFAQIREQKRPVAAHLARVAIHHFERSSHIRRQIDFIDHQQIGADDARSALARDLVAAGHVDHVDGGVHQLRAERRRQIVAAAFDEDQLQARMRALQILDRFQVHGSVLADGGMRAAAGLDAGHALGRQRALADQEFGVFARVNVVGDDGQVHRRP
jgi:hypothetical protein